MDWNTFATALGFFVVAVWNGILYQRQARQVASATTTVATVVKKETAQQTGTLANKLDRIEGASHELTGKIKNGGADWEKEVRQLEGKVAELNSYMRQRIHDVLNGQSILVNKLSAIGEALAKEVGRREALEQIVKAGSPAPPRDDR